MGIKITASRELVFRLRLAAPNDTICLCRAYAFRSYVCRSGVGSAGAVFLMKKFNQIQYYVYDDPNKTNSCDKTGNQSFKII